MDNYYTKYLKYKNKYIELKRANSGVGIGVGVIMGGSGSVIRGGYLGSEPCPKTFGIKSVWYYLRKYNCTFEILNKKIPKKVEAITYQDFLRTNNKHPDYQKITITYLLNREFPVEFFTRKRILRRNKKRIKST
jgi:hypothetical protein